MLQRMQSNANIQVQIVPDDFPSIREVDLKLLELAKKWEAKVVTNDFNLNKVAHLHHVEVLNINDLANALKPVVLPGETMNVLILKEGKEYNQGVGYLDDGTMVVVDHARKLIGQLGGHLRDQRAADRQRQDDLRQDGREREDVERRKRRRESVYDAGTEPVFAVHQAGLPAAWLLRRLPEYHANAKRPRPPYCERKPGWFKRSLAWSRRLHGAGRQSLLRAELPLHWHISGLLNTSALSGRSGRPRRGCRRRGF